MSDTPQISTIPSSAFSNIRTVSRILDQIPIANNQQAHSKKQVLMVDDVSLDKKKFNFNVVEFIRVLMANNFSYFDPKKVALSKASKSFKKFVTPFNLLVLGNGETNDTQ